MEEANRNRIQKLIEIIKHHLITQLRFDEKGFLRFIDPNEGIEISAHYGVSHLAASLLMTDDKGHSHEYYIAGRNLLLNLIENWENEHKIHAYHFDFNNFALLICYDNLNENDSLRAKIKEIILKAPDSNHTTINWLPMRLIVNERRLKWTDDNKYRVAMQRCIDLINQATNSDGGIEDRLPKGLSFNLQYDISSLATICFSSDLLPSYDINSGINFLLNHISPDGDINYQGRGCNQVFAWGPWIYLLSVFGRDKELANALDYLENRLILMLENNSMMLNEWQGQEKYLWWDYHYASVYSAHVLLWLILANRDTRRLEKIFTPLQTVRQDTGLIDIKSDDFFISIFKGRTEYLAEFGPSINLIWTRELGTIFKGMFAPWRGLFGNKNSFDDVAMMNYFGLFCIENKDAKGIIGKIQRKIQLKTKKNINYSKYPLFCPIEIEEEKNQFSIIWSIEKEMNAYLNAPSLCNFPKAFLYVDGIECPLYLISRFRNQYGWLDLRQSRIIKGRVWKLTVFLH